MKTHGYIQHDSPVVDALEELSAKKLYTHYGKNQPENETHEKDVEDTGYRVHQGVHHNLKLR